MQLKMIMSETRRSFIHNIYINLLLIIQFILCFFLSITILTFYIDIGNSKSLSQIEQINSKEWYTIRLDMTRSMSNVNDIALESDGFSRVRDFYREITDGSLFQQITFRSGQSIYLDSAWMDDKYGKGNYNSFVNSEGISSINAAYNKLYDEGKEFIGVRIKSVQMNQNAYQLLSLKVEEGEGLTKENTTLMNKDSFMPIILGHNYKDTIQVGDTFRIQLPVMATDHWGYNVKVVGILEEDSWIPDYGGSSQLISLDDYIICPVGMDIRYIPKFQEERAKLTSGQYSDALFYSFITLNSGVSYSDAIIKANELSQKYDVYNLLFTSTSFGMDMLQNETETTITMITILAFMMLCFTMFCMVSSAISKIQKNLRTYAIYLVNGSSIANVIIPYLLEMLVLLLPSISVNYLLLAKKMQMTHNYVPFFAVIVMAAVVFTGMSVFLSVRLSRIETEVLMRRKE